MLFAKILNFLVLSLNAEIQFCVPRMGNHSVHCLHYGHHQEWTELTDQGSNLEMKNGNILEP